MDDQPIFRKGLRELIEEEPSIHVAGEASDGEEAWRLIQFLRPHIAVLDVEMPKASGIEVAQRIQSAGLAVKVIILTMYKQLSIFNSALDAGVMGYLLKVTAVTDIIDAIRHVSAGEFYISPELTRQALKNRNPLEPAVDVDKLKTLTATERSILKLIASAKSSKEIADQLHISYRTVERHRYNICSKLEVNGSYALLRFSLENRELL